MKITIIENLSSNPFKSNWHKKNIEPIDSELCDLSCSQIRYNFSVSGMDIIIHKNNNCFCMLKGNTLVHKGKEGHVYYRSDYCKFIEKESMLTFENFRKKERERLEKEKNSGDVVVSL